MEALPRRIASDLVVRINEELAAAALKKIRGGECPLKSPGPRLAGRGPVVNGSLAPEGRPNA